MHTHTHREYSLISCNQHVANSTTPKTGNYKEEEKKKKPDSEQPKQILPNTCIKLIHFTHRKEPHSGPHSETMYSNLILLSRQTQLPGCHIKNRDREKKNSCKFEGETGRKRHTDWDKKERKDTAT